MANQRESRERGILAPGDGMRILARSLGCVCAIATAAFAGQAGPSRPHPEPPSIAWPEPAAPAIPQPPRAPAPERSGSGPIDSELSPRFVERWRQSAERREERPVGFLTRLFARWRQRQPTGNRYGSLEYGLDDVSEVLPPRVGAAPLPGTPFNPGASGPGVSASPDTPVLGGLLDPRTGWPYVVGFHFKPRPTLTENFWIAATYGNPQVLRLGSGRNLEIGGISSEALLERRSLDALLAAMTEDRVVVIQVHGNHTYFDAALAGGLWTHSWLTLRRAMPSNALFLDFDWPSWRVYRSDLRDVNEKGRRAYIAGLHLAELIQRFPPETRVCLIGQSYGGRVVTSALHLLGGGTLRSHPDGPAVRLPSTRFDLHLRAVIIGAAVDHDWLNPGERLDRALLACEGLLNLHNSRDVALTLYPFLFRGGHRHSIGRRGLTRKDLNALGPLAHRVEQFDTLSEVGPAHTLLESTADREIAWWMAPYLWMPRQGVR